MKRRWMLCPQRPELGRMLSDRLGVHPVVGNLLVNRGVENPEAGRSFLERKLTGLHDPQQLPGVVEAAERIHRAARDGRKICIYGDYDVDGMCATAILSECLRLAGVAARSYLPDRVEEGYGVNAEALRKLRADGIDLVVSVDCGITSVEEARVAREIGLEFIVTDHHEPAEELPDAATVVHARLPGSQYPFGELCGAGVVFKLAWELSRLFSGQRKTTDTFQKFLLDATSLAAIATVCDVVPLSDENRVLVHHGLRSLTRAPTLGLRHLMDVAGLAEKKRLSSGDIGFTLGPRLNACGRLGQARLGVELLTTRDESRAAQLARYLDGQNKDRQTLERRIFTEARKMAEERYDLDDPKKSAILVLESESAQWHPGVIGIVASRMVERYGRPCILISLRDSVGTGSGRSIPGFHLLEAISACAEHLITSGGHAMAAGLRIERARIGPFRDRLGEQAATMLTDGVLAPEVRVDIEVPLHVLTPGLINSFEVLEPFGPKNPTPVMLATDLNVVGEPKLVGGGERHLAFRVRQNGKAYRAIAFQQADRVEELMSRDGKCCVVFSPFLNDYRGYPEVELRVKDFRPGTDACEEAPAPCPNP